MFSGIEEVNLDGFQVVRGETFLHLPKKSEAACTIWPNKIGFNRFALTTLNCCEYIRIEINPLKKSILIVPVTSKDKDCIRWVKGQKSFTTRIMESKRFGDELYSSWELDRSFNYRAHGRLVSSNGKVMLLFDFSEPEIWRSQKGEIKNE